MSRRLTTEEFIAKARAVHGDKYDYSKVEYVTTKTKVLITCPEHGDFEQAPNDHLQGKGCPECAVKRRTKTTEEFKAEARAVHGNKYDYSKVEYVNDKAKVIIVCFEHGSFGQRPSSHLGGAECPKCAGRYSPTTEEFKAKAEKVHGNKYDYSRVDYAHSQKKVTIICDRHGIFEQKPSNHLLGRGCPQCAAESRTKTAEEFKAEAKKVHGDKYDYSKVEYMGGHTKVIITCLKHGHGDFEQTPANHLRGQGCPQCAVESRTKTAEEFKAEAKKIHDNKYDYSKVEYKNADIEVCIICPDHKEFWQRPANHLQGSGCPICAQSFTSEPIFRKALEEMTSLKFPKKKPEWLINSNTSRLLELDCYNEKSKIAFELQGGQHYEPIEFFGGEEAFQKTLERDQIKKTICEKKGIHLFCIDQRPASKMTPQQKEEYYKKQIKKCLQQLPQHVKIKMNRR